MADGNGGRHTLMAAHQGNQSPGAHLRPSAQPFVGRDRELSVLQAALDDAASGRGRLVLLVGEPGIGKSRTADELAGLARGNGFEVLFGRCYEGPGAPAFWPWVQVLRSWARGRDAGEIADALGPAAQDIAQIWPDLCRLVPGLTAPPGEPSDQARFRLFDGVAGFFIRVSRNRPILLVLDDLHGADRPSLILLQFLAREMRDANVAIVGTFRDVALSLGHPLAEALGELAREANCDRLSLKGLVEAEIARYLELAAGFPPPGAMAAAIHTRTSGNPLFVSELVRFLMDDGRLAEPGAAATWNASLPEAVRVVIGRRLSHLSAPCVDALTVASCFGREFPENALGVACGFDRSRVHELLEEARAARLVDPAPDRFGRYRFTHALVRDALFGEVPNSQQAALHRRVGEAIEAVSGGDADAPLAELAASFFAAADDRAVDYARRAGDRAMTLLAFEEAVSQYRLSLRALEASRSSDDETRSALLLALGEAQNRSGDVEQSKQTILQVAEIARAHDDRLLLGRAALAYGERGVWGEIGSVDHVLVQLLEEAVAAWGEEDSAVHAKLLARLATSLVFAESPARRVELADRGLEMARRIGDRDALAIALIARHAIVWTPDNVEERFAMSSELVKLIDEGRDPEGAFQAHVWRLCNLLELGEIRAVDLELGACRRLSDRLRDAPHRWQVEVLRGTRAAIEGRFEVAESLTAELLLGRGQGRGTTSIFWLVIWTARWLQGRLGELEAPVAELMELIPGALGVMRPVFAMVMRHEGREAEARSHFGALAANDFAEVPKDQNFLVAGACLAEVCTFLGDGRAAEVLYPLLQPYVRSHVVDANGVTYLGAMSQYLGMLARTMGRWEAAAGHLDDAIRAYAAMNALPWLAIAQHEYATVLLDRARPGDIAEATRLALAARSTAEAVGMGLLRRQIEALDERLRIGSTVEPDSADPPSQPETAPELVAEAVFRKEGEFWTVTFEGRTVHVRNSRGLRYLARLLGDPGHEFHVTELVGPMSVGRDDPGLDDELRVSGSLGTAGEPIDQESRAAYRRRIAFLRAELEEAERLNDLGRSEPAREEIAMLEDELLAAARGRRVSSNVERARQTVGKGLARAIARVDTAHPDLGRHLTATVRRGYFCAYIPDRRRPVRWSV